MENEGWTRAKICHWCGKTYNAQIGYHRRRFCGSLCKQAHYRAYKKYVTVIRRRKRFLELQAVTTKKAKKGGDKRG